MNRITVSENGLSKDFKTTVTKLEQDLISIADSYPEGEYRDYLKELELL